MRVDKLKCCPLLHPLLILLLLLPFPRDLLLDFKQQQRWAVCDQVLFCILGFFLFFSYLVLSCSRFKAGVCRPHAQIASLLS